MKSVSSKHAVWRLLFLTMGLCFFVSNGILTAETKQEKPAKKTVAVIPVQKMLPFPIYLSTHPSFFDLLKRSYQEKKFSLKNQIDYDPEFVQQTLNRLITNMVLRHGFLVFSPEQVAPQFRVLTKDQKQLSIDKLNEPFNADALLFVTITEWNAEEFDRDGTAKVGFEAVLIDSAKKQTIWSNRATGLKLRVPSEDDLYYKYEEDLLSDLSDRILKGFPKNDLPVS